MIFTVVKLVCVAECLLAKNVHVVESVKKGIPVGFHEAVAA